MKTRYILAFLLPLTFAISSAAKDNAMSFLSISPDPVSMAMGGTSSSGAFSHFGSLADPGVGGGSFAAGISYGYFQPSVSASDVVSLGAVYGIDERFGLTFGFLGNIGDKYGVTGEFGESLGVFRPSEFRIGAGFTWKILEKFSAGIALNYAQSSHSPKMDGVRSVSRTGFADIQFRYQPLGWLGVSLTGKNLGIPVDSYALPY